MTRSDIISAFHIADDMLRTLTAAGIHPTNVQARTYTDQPVSMSVPEHRFDEAAELLACGPAYAPEVGGNVYRESKLVTLYAGREKWQNVTGRRPVTS